MESTENIISAMDDLTLLYTAIYMVDPEMAELAHVVLPRIDKEDMSNALYYAAMGMKKELLELDRHCHQE